MSLLKALILCCVIMGFIVYLIDEQYELFRQVNHPVTDHAYAISGLLA